MFKQNSQSYSQHERELDLKYGDIKLDHHIFVLIKHDKIKGFSNKFLNTSKMKISTNT